MNKILDILQYSTEAYNYLLWTLWLNWAEHYAANDQELQSLIANTALFNWWKQEYDRLESEFLADIDPYIGKIDVQYLRTLHDKKVVQIGGYFSIPLIKNAKKQIIIPQIN